MKILALADLFIPVGPMKNGLESLCSKGCSLIVRQWEHKNLEMLQKDNLAVELGGPEAVAAPLDLVARAEDTEILVVQFAPVSKALMQALPKLKLISVLRGGVENVDLEAARERGITVLNTPGRNARAVAEFTVGLMLAETRNIARGHAAMKQGIWLKEFPNSAYIPEIGGKTIGLIGFGAIGHLVATFLKAFGCSILVYDPYLKSAPEGVTLALLDQVLKEADIVSLHARLSDETHHLISEREISLMKPTAVLINTARSGLLDQEAIVHALQTKRIQGAALDVFDREPIPQDDPILALDNLTLVPHAAGSTADAFLGSPKLAAVHIGKWLEQNGNN